MEYIALLLTSFLFGGMLLFSLGFGTLCFKFLEPSVAKAFIRKTFPYFYVYVLVVSALIILFSLKISNLTIDLTFSIFITKVLACAVLMPAIDNESNPKHKKSFVLLHTSSVMITLLYIIIPAFLLFIIFTS